MNKCFKCGTESEGKFCPECGIKYEETKTCPQCGAEVNGQVKFCSQCGYSFVQTDNTVATSTLPKQKATANSSVDKRTVTKEVFSKIKGYALKYAPIVLFALWSVLLWAFYAAKVVVGDSLFFEFSSNLYQTLKEDLFEDLFPVLNALLSFAIISNVYVVVLGLVTWKCNEKSNIIANCGGILLQLAVFICALVTSDEVADFGMGKGSFVAIVASFTAVFATLSLVFVIWSIYLQLKQVENLKEKIKQIITNLLRLITQNKQMFVFLAWVVLSWLLLFVSFSGYLEYIAAGISIRRLLTYKIPDTWGGETRAYLNLNLDFYKSILLNIILSALLFVLYVIMYFRKNQKGKFAISIVCYFIQGFVFTLLLGLYIADGNTAIVLLLITIVAIIARDILQKHFGPSIHVVSELRKSNKGKSWAIICLVISCVIFSIMLLNITMILTNTGAQPGLYVDDSNELNRYNFLRLVLFFVIFVGAIGMIVISVLAIKYAKTKADVGIIICWIVTYSFVEFLSIIISVHEIWLFVVYLIIYTVLVLVMCLTSRQVKQPVADNENGQIAIVEKQEAKGTPVKSVDGQETVNDTETK